MYKEFAAIRFSPKIFRSESIRSYQELVLTGLGDLLKFG